MFKSQLGHITLIEIDHEIISVLILQGPVVQRNINLTNSLVVKMLTILVSTIPNSQVFLLKKM